MNCETCVYYEWDEEEEEYFCGADMDEDDFARLSERKRPQCPFYRYSDEYAVVRHQM